MKLKHKGAAARVADGKIGLCTLSYSHSQDVATKAEIARRVAAPWNLAIGIPTEELEAADASGFRRLILQLVVRSFYRLFWR